MNSQVIKAVYFSSTGRLGRLAYFGYALALGVAFFVAAAILTMLLGMVGLILSMVLYLGVLYCEYNVAAKRFQDLNQPGQYALYMMGIAFLSGVLSRIGSLELVGSLLSLLVLVAALYLLFVPGTAGANTYGPAPDALPDAQ